MRLWLMVTVAAVALTACTDAAILGSDSDSEGETAGNTALFCRAWPEARSTIVGAVSGTTSFDLLGDRSVGLDRNFVDSDATLADVDRVVPAVVRAEWGRAYEAYARVSDLLFVTGYTEGVFRPVHVTMAFGDRGPEGVAADAEVAVAAIDDWAVEACGDFCSRWPELKDAVVFDGFNGDWYPIMQRIDRDEAAIRAGSLLVPDELTSQWETAEAIKSGFLAMFREQGLQTDFPAGWLTDEIFVEWVGLPHDEAVDASMNAIESMVTWAAHSCDPDSVTGGGPGTLSIRVVPHEHLTARTVVAVLLPPGTHFGSVRGVDDYVALTCTAAQGSPEEWERGLEHAAEQAAGTGLTPEEYALEHWIRAEPLRPLRQDGEYYEFSVCGLIRHEEGEAIVPGGSYELFVGAFIGEPGNYAVYFAAPEYCTQFPVTVNGDTVVDLPELEPCDLDPVGRPEEIVRRVIPPFEPGGTLRVEVDSVVTPEGFDQCGLKAVLLPALTTLDDVGTGDAWPNGGFSFYRYNPEHFEGDPEARRWAEAPGFVPILPAPPSGTGEVGLWAAIRGDGPWDTFFPDPVPLAAGAYDLRVEEACHREGEDYEVLRCGVVTIEVNGDTVVEMPELEDCSWPE
ncbi:MAG: hypothetical protein ACNYZH_07465 [Acidimicrobiia bacterium]